MVVEVISYFVGQNILSETTRSIYNGISGIISHQNTEVNKILEEIDVITSTKIVNSIVDEVKKHHYKSQTFNLAVSSLLDILKKIDLEIEEINKDVVEHKEKWFNTWRTPAYVVRIERLRILKKNMDTRLQYLVDIIRINGDLYNDNLSNNSFSNDNLINYDINDMNNINDTLNDTPNLTYITDYFDNEMNNEINNMEIENTSL
jgi:hypothetical protein